MRRAPACRKRLLSQCSVRQSLLLPHNRQWTLGRHFDLEIDTTHEQVIRMGAFSRFEGTVADPLDTR